MIFDEEKMTKRRQRLDASFKRGEYDDKCFASAVNGQRAAARLLTAEYTYDQALPTLEVYKEPLHLDYALDSFEITLTGWWHGASPADKLKLEIKMACSKES